MSGIKPLRISVVSYLNALPYAEGFKHTALPPDWTVTYDIPSECARKLIAGEADLGLIPVAKIPALKERAFIVTDYGIGADGEVASVMLFSNEPPDSLTSVILDRESRTSVKLAEILAEKRWNINPEWIAEGNTDLQNVNETQGAVVIGDRALKMRGKFRYETDLALEWKKMTGLPFVFASWVCTRPLGTEEQSLLNSVFREGMQRRHQIVADNPLKDSVINVSDYLFRYISYELNDDFRRGMNLFLEYLKEL